MLRAVEDRYDRGEIDGYTRQLYRVAAVKAPWRLPDGLRQLATARRTDTRYVSLTPVMLGAWQWVSRNDAQGSELHALLTPPSDYAYFIDSTTLPIRVGYRDPGLVGAAESALQAAEYAWTVEVDDYGFYAPPIERGAQVYRIFIGDAGANAAGYCSPYLDNDETPWADCFSYIVVDAGSAYDPENGVVAHELSHATQAAMDCQEVRTYWENTSTYIQSQVYPASFDYTLYAIGQFQQQPWQPLDYMAYGSGDFYEYGGSLLNLWLADTYAAPGEGGALVAEIWTAAIQENTDLNEPDYYDAIAEVVSSRGGASDFEDIFVDFCEARFFLGSRDDGAHITDAQWLYDTEVFLAGRHTASSLPIVNGHVDQRYLPGQYGVSYSLLDLGGPYPYPMQVRFQGSTSSRWRVRILRYDDELPTTSAEVTIDASSAVGELTVPGTDHRYFVLMAAALGPPGWDPDSSSNRHYLFTYDLTPELPPLAVQAVSPDPVERGRQVQHMALHGEGFMDGSQFDIEFDDPGMEVSIISSVEPTTVSFLLNVDDDTALGPHDVTVTNRDGTQATGVAVLTVVEEGEAGDAGVGPSPDESSKGCACNTSAPPSGLLPLLLVLFVRRLANARSRGGRAVDGATPARSDRLGDRGADDPARG